MSVTSNSFALDSSLSPIYQTLFFLYSFIVLSCDIVLSLGESHYGNALGSLLCLPLFLSFRESSKSCPIIYWKAFPSSFRNKESKAACDLSSWYNPYFKRKAQIPFPFSRYLAFINGFYFHFLSANYKLHPKTPYKER